MKVDNPSDLPSPQSIDFIEEPYFRVSIITPKDYTGALMDLCQTRRGDMQKLEYLSPERVELHYLIPLAEVVVDFFDQMKSRTQGYASLDYELSGYRQSNLVRVDLLLNGIAADAFSTIVHRDKAFGYGNRMCEKLKELIPRQMFDVPIQAAIGGKIIARETATGASQSSSLRAEMNTSPGTSTRPIAFIFFLPSFCFSSSLRLREMSPP